MATKKTLRATPDEVAEEKPRPADVLAMAEEDDDARRFLKARALIESLKAQDVRIKLLRRDAKTGKWAYIGSFDADIFDEDFVQREYGPGSYKFSCFGGKTDNNPSGYLGGGSFDVANTATPPATATPNNNREDGFSMRELLALMMQQNTALIAALAGKGGNGGGANEIVDAALKLAELTRPPQTDPVAMILKGMELADARSGDGGGDFNASLLEGVARPLAQIVEHQMARQNNPQPIKQEIGTMPRRPAIWTADGHAPDWLKAMTPTFGMLLGMAKQGVSAGVVVDLIFDRADDVTLDRIAGDCIAPNWISETIAFLPPAFGATFRPWTEAVLTELRTELLAPDEPADDPTGHEEGTE